MAERKAMLNKCMFIGNLGADPELRFTASGTAMTSFRLAVSRVSTVDGQRREETEWVSCVTWQKTAEFVNQYAHKGSKVYVEGRLQTRSWDGPDGAKRWRTEVIVSNVELLDRAAKRPESDDEIDPDYLPF
jgi:single-strand DNA-binding protein